MRTLAEDARNVKKKQKDRRPIIKKLTIMDKEVHHGAPLSADQIAQIEAGLAAEREGRIISNEEADARLVARRTR